VARPLVLLGHSAGGFYVREYTRQFPREVAALVLVDSTSPQQIDELPGFRERYEEDKRNRRNELVWRSLRVWSGWDRLWGRCHGDPPAALRHLAGQFDALRCRLDYVGGDFGEFVELETAARQAARTASVGKIPVLIVSQDPDVRREGMDVRDIAETPVWAHEQEGLKALSPLSWRVIARGAGHAVFNDRPDVIVKEVAALIDYLQGGAAPPFGTTTAW
jgi:pimeloyl-ACP methyl ester carboxylesterase